MLKRSGIVVLQCFLTIFKASNPLLRNSLFRRMTLRAVILGVRIHLEFHVRSKNQKLLASNKVRRVLSTKSPHYDLSKRGCRRSYLSPHRLIRTVCLTVSDDSAIFAPLAGRKKLARKKISVRQCSRLINPLCLLPHQQKDNPPITPHDDQDREEHYFWRFGSCCSCSATKDESPRNRLHQHQNALRPRLSLPPIPIPCQVSSGTDMRPTNR